MWLATDSAGNALVSFYGAGSVVELAKIDPSGNTTWNLDHGDWFVATDADDNIVTAGTQCDFGLGRESPTDPQNTIAICVGEYAPDGTNRWGRLFEQSAPDGSLVYTDALVTDAGGNVVLAGWNRSNHVSAPMYFDAFTVQGTTAADVNEAEFLAELSPDGDVLWARLSDLYVARLAADTTGRVFFAGFIAYPPVGGCASALAIGELDVTGAELWRRTFPVDPAAINLNLALAASSNGKLALAGTAVALDLGAGVLPDGLFVAEFDDSGEVVWAHGYGAANFISLAFDPAQDLFVSGVLIGTCDPVDFGAGSIVRTGCLSNPSIARETLVLAKLDPNGATLWSRHFDEQQETTAWMPMATDAAGALFMLGAFGANVDFGGVTVTTPSGQSQLFLAKFDP
jgi:hypothetical protein